jgi:LytS/YehU family sensor histidine kinase
MAVTSAILFFVIIYNRQIHLTAKQKQDELRLESLRSQMNPHFVFNALNSVNYFISNNDKFSANSFIADFSRLIRATLNNLSQDFIPFEQEIESIRDYLRLEHLRFSDKFNYELNIEIELRADFRFPRTGATNYRKCDMARNTWFGRKNRIDKSNF